VTENSLKYEDSGLCRAVPIIAEGAPLRTTYYHCPNYRKADGSPFVTDAGCQENDVSLKWL
jgi:hypothetical protein